MCCLSENFNNAGERRSTVRDPRMHGSCITNPLFEAQICVLFLGVMLPCIGKYNTLHPKYHIKYQKQQSTVLVLIANLNAPEDLISDKLLRTSAITAVTQYPVNLSHSAFC
jgi:hypothetical protein